MAIEFVCPSCGGTLQMGDEAAGRVIRCGGCMTALRVPAPDPAPRSAPPPPPPPAAHSAPISPFETDAPTPRRPAPREATPVEPLPEDDPALPTAHRVDSRDDPDRPRRRRGPPPPPPASSRRVMVWLLAIAGIGGVALLACCGGLFLFLPGANWQKHESSEGGFKVDLPGELHPGIEKQANIRLEPGGNAHAEGAPLARKLQQYMVIYRDIDGTKKREDAEGSDEKQLDTAMNKLLGTGAKLKGEPKELTVGGFPARDFEFQSPKGWYVVRIIVADTRQYILLVHSALRPNAADVRRFVDSFEITHPELVKEGKRREAWAKANPGIPVGWEEYRAGTDKFRMTMPRKVVTSDDPKAGRTHKSEDKRARLLVAVHVTTFPAGVAPDTQKIMANLALAAFKSGNEKKVKSEPVQYRGQEMTQLVVEFTDKPGGADAKPVPRMIVRAVTTETRLYLVTVTSSNGADGLKDVDAVFNTFHPVD